MGITMTFTVIDYYQSASISKSIHICPYILYRDINCTLIFDLTTVKYWNRKRSKIDRGWESKMAGGEIRIVFAFGDFRCHCWKAPSISKHFYFHHYTATPPPQKKKIFIFDKIILVLNFSQYNCADRNGPKSMKKDKSINRLQISMGTWNEIECELY